MGAVAESIERWQIVHEELVRIGMRRGAIDAEEAIALREAEEVQIWKPLGMVSMLDYLERELGYAPKKAQDRLRVARALRHLPQLSEALAIGALHYSAIRELVRVATPATEVAWRDFVRGKNLRQIEDAVSGRRPGDLPTDPPDEQVRTYTVRFDEVIAADYATFTQARQAMNDERGTHLSDTEVLAALTGAYLHPTGTADSDGRAKHQCTYAICEMCDRMWQEAAGRRILVDDATKEQVLCDAQHIGSTDAATPERAKQDIPPATVRFVWRRDQGRCQTPGCRSTRCLEIHHIVPRARGGTHVPSNLTLRCDSCHRAHHVGLITIAGTAPNQLTTTRRTVTSRASLSHATTTSKASPTAPHHRAADADLKARVLRASPSNARPATAQSGANATPTAPRSPAIAPPTPPHHRAADVALNAQVLRASPSNATLATALSPKFEAATQRQEAIKALTTSGFHRAIASRAVDEACAHVGANAALPELLLEAFRRCPRGVA